MQPSPLRLLLAAVPAGLLLAVGLSSISWIPNFIYADRVLAGVSLAGVDLGNTAPQLVQQLLTELTTQTKPAPVQLRFEDSVWDIDPAKFGLHIDPERLALLAISVGRRGTLSQRLSENWSALLGRRQAIIADSEALSDFDRAALEEFLHSLAANIDQPQHNAVLKIINDRATNFVAPQTGQQLDIEQTIDLVAGSILSGTRKVDLPVKVITPTITLAETNTLGINVLLGKGESDFSGSPTNRRHNIKVGAEKFDGVIIKPGETFSFVTQLGPVDRSTGFLPELVIKGDETTPEFGGGLCQVSTTAFRGILRAGLPVVERRNHSYRVVYYEPAGSDATIYQPSPDLKFTNDTPGHLLIDTYIIGNKLYFDFYGTDTGRQVELEGPKIFNVTAYPEPVYIDTSTLPPGETKQIDSAHRGADAVLTRKIFQHNKLVHTDVFRSHYVPWPAKFLRGVEDAVQIETNPDNIDPLTPPSSDSSTPPTP